MEKVKKGILEKIEGANLNKLMDLAYSNGSFSYDYLVGINARKSGKYSSFKDIEDYCFLIYTHWYNNLLKINDGDKKPEVFQAIQKIRNNSKYKPENMKQSGFYNFFSSAFDKEIGVKEITPVLMQNFIWEHNQGSGGFMHVQTNRINMHEQKTDVTIRLYLNLDINNIFPFSKQLLEICLEKNINLYTKMGSNDSRNENIVIYTNYQEAGKIIEVIDSIRDKNPRLFKGAENINPVMGKINNYIGFGEEPVYKSSSFNIERANAIGDAVNTANNKFYKETILKEESAPTINTSTGGTLHRDDYFVYMFKNIIKQKYDEKDFDFSLSSLQPQISVLKRNLIDFTPDDKILFLLKNKHNQSVSISIDMKSIEDKLCSVFGYMGGDNRIEKLYFFTNNVLNTTNSKTISTSTKKLLSTDEYLDYIIKKASINELYKNIIDIKTGKKIFTVHEKYEKLKFYENALHEITENTKLGKTYVAVARTNFKLDIEQGISPNLNLTMLENNKNNESQSTNSIKLDFDIASKLKSVFPEKSEEAKALLHSRKFVEPIFKKYDVSYDYPHLNLSSLKSHEIDMER